jgi:hypothetical protein
LALGDAFEEAEVKAALVFKLTRFVEWPEAAFADRSEQLFCVVGSASFHRMLARVTEGKTVGGRTIRTARVERGDELEACDMAFFSAAGPGIAELGVVVDRPMLTIGDVGVPVGEGIMIALELDRQRFRFAVDTEPAERVGLRISSHLLSLAREVHTARGPR